MTGIALITGASSGLGAEYAHQLAAAQTDLVLVARDRAALEALAADLTARAGVTVEVLPADLTDPTQLAAVVERLSDRTRPVSILVNNAGFGLPLAFERNDIEDEARHLVLHNEVPLRLMHAVLPTMLEAGHGRIINIASVAGFTPRSTYGACKAWLISFSRWANARYRGRGVSVTAVCPGFTHTNFHERAGLPPGEEGVPGWMWLNARDVVAESLRASARGRAVSVPSLRYKVIMGVTKVIPPAWVARAAARGR